MRIVVIIFAVLALLVTAGVGSLSIIRANDEVKSLKETFDAIETAKAEAEKDEYAKMKYDIMQKTLQESGFGDITPGKVSTWGYLSLVTGFIAFLTLIFVFTKKDNITLYLGIGVILFAVVTYFVAPVIPETKYGGATFKQISLILLIAGLIGGGLAILAGKLRKPAAV